MADGQGLDIPGLATLVFGRVVDTFTAAGITLPERRIMAPGAAEAIAFDCPMLAMTMAGIGIGSAPGVGAGPRQAGAGLSAMGLRHVVFTVTLIRTEPKPSGAGTRPPAASVLSEAALSFWRDAGVMSHALVRVGTDLTKTKRLPIGTQVETGAVIPLGPEGGLVGLRATIAVTADRLT